MKRVALHLKDGQCFLYQRSRDATTTPIRTSRAGLVKPRRSSSVVPPNQSRLLRLLLRLACIELRLPPPSGSSVEFQLANQSATSVCATSCMRLHLLRYLCVRSRSGADSTIKRTWAANFAKPSASRPAHTVLASETNREPRLVTRLSIITYQLSGALSLTYRAPLLAFATVRLIPSGSAPSTVPTSCPLRS